MSWVGVGISLVGAASANRAQRRGATAARTLGQEAADRVSPFLLNTGFTTQVNSGIPTAGNPQNAGPSFTFGGNNGALAPIGNPNFNANASINPADDPIANGFVAFGPDGQYFLNTERGTVFDQQGNAVNALPVAPGSSRLNIALPDLSGFENFNVDGDLAQVGQAIAGLDGVNSELSGLADQFSTNPDDPGLLLDIANQAGELLPRVAQGASEMRDARLNNINNAESALVSDLTENMARRRILGSSFGNASLSQARIDASQARGEAEAQSTLEEISATASILGFQSQVIERSGQIVLSALAQRSANTQAQGSLALGAAQARTNAASVALGARQASFANEVAALELAFAGQEQAQRYVQNLLALSNGATQIQIGAEVSAADAETEGILGLTAAASGAATTAEERRRNRRT